MVVKQIGGHWSMLLSYWDGGFVQLNVNDPVNPTLIGDTDFTNPIRSCSSRSACRCRRRGTAIRPSSRSTTSTSSGPTRTSRRSVRPSLRDRRRRVRGPVCVRSGAGRGSDHEILADEKLNGPAVYGGYGCPTSAPVPTPASVPGYLGSLLPARRRSSSCSAGRPGPECTGGGVLPRREGTSGGAGRLGRGPVREPPPR